MVRTISICADVAQYQVVNKWLYAQWSGQVEVWCPVMGRLTGGNRGGPKCAKFGCWTASIHDAYLGFHEHNLAFPEQIPSQGLVRCIQGQTMSSSAGSPSSSDVPPIFFHAAI
jgi:hypothetical protein